MLRRVIAVAVMVSITAFSLTASAMDNSSGMDNSTGDGAKKVEGGVKAIGKSAEEIGAKAGKAAEGAAKDTGNALGKAWDDIVRGLKKAFK